VSSRGLAVGFVALAAALAAAADDGFFVSRFAPGTPRSWVPEAGADLRPHPTDMLMWEVTRTPTVTEPTAEELTRADDLVARSRESAERHGWLSFEHAVRDGYELIFADHQHYVNREYLLDDHVLDPDRPEFVMYYETPRGPKLAGFMYMVDQPAARGPQIGGPLTVWHYHVWPQPVCLFEQRYPIGLPDASGKCATGATGEKSPEMMHVWFVEHPEGPFSTAMNLSPELRAQLLEPAPADGDPHCKLPALEPAGVSLVNAPALDYVPPAGTRFRNNWNGTAYDRLTGLEWEVKTDGSGCTHCAADRYTWSGGSGNPDGTAYAQFLDVLNNTCDGDGHTRCDAPADCKGIGSGFCGFAGAHDWRLPTERELRGLLTSIEPACSAPCLDGSMPGARTSGVHWTSTASHAIRKGARAVFFDGRGVVDGSKTDQAHVRAVRGESVR
jgi:hypothetical protein